MKTPAFDTVFKNAASKLASQFIADVTGVTGVVFATADGFEITYATMAGIDVSRIAATTSSMSAIGNTVAAELGMGVGQHIALRTANGYVFILTSVANNLPYSLTVVADTSAVLAQIQYRANTIVQALSTT